MERLRELADSGDELPYHESGVLLNQLLHTCGQLIRENSALAARVKSADKLIEELNIEITVKDLEIFNFDTQKEDSTQNDD